MQLIEYGAVYRYAFRGVHGGGLEDEDFNAIINAIDAVPTVDAVPVVRCKDCKFRMTPKCPTYHIAYFSERESWELGGDDDFCSYGERKEGEG